MSTSHSTPVRAAGREGVPSAEWHTLTLAETCTSLNVPASAPGLVSGEAEKRLVQWGPNSLAASVSRGFFAALASQFATILVWLLILAAAVSAIFGDWLDAAAIGAIVILNATIGASQEYRAEQSIAALRSLTAPKARVVRDGRIAVVAAAGVVPGDRLLLESGDLVAADARVVEAASLSCIEKTLTGESDPSAKIAREEASPSATPLGDRAGMVYAGTAVAHGTAAAVVVATGMNTQVGRIAAMIATVRDDTPTPLQGRLASVGRVLVIAALVIVAGMFGLGVLRGEPLLGLFMTSVSLAVAAVPEGLPAIVTVALALGVRRMARRGALIRHLPAVETLGATSVICTDKTGTLTVGQMTARVLVVPIGSALSHIDLSGEGYGPEGAATHDAKPVEGDVQIAATRLACNLAGVNNAVVTQDNGRWESAGDPTEAAMLVAAAKLGVTREALDASSPKLAEAPFDSNRKRSAAVRQSAGATGGTGGTGGAATVLVNGAPGGIIALCTHVADGKAARTLADEDRRALLDANTALAASGLRVLACASRSIASNHVADAQRHADPATLELGLTFVGLVGLLDPPRTEAKRAVERCIAAGIKVVMITGDQAATAMAIAMQLGIAGQGDAAMTGTQLEAMDDAALEAKVATTVVYARVTAADKLRIVRAWRARGEVVAMTGDGVNDAPALKGADVGVAMGASGTEVARQASDMVITDDNFASIVAAVEEGRGVYDNIRKTMQFLLGGNSAELLFMAAAMLAGLPSPLLPIQILWINLVTDGLPALFLAADPSPPGVMERPPRLRNAGFIDSAFIGTMTLTALLTAGVAMAVYLYELSHADEPTARTHAFAALVFAELLRSFGARSETVPVWRMHWRGSAKLLGVVSASFALQVGLHHSEGFASVMKTVHLDLVEIVPLIAVAAVPFLVMEVVKVVRQMKWRR